MQPLGFNDDSIINHCLNTTLLYTLNRLKQLILKKSALQTMQVVSIAGIARVSRQKTVIMRLSHTNMRSPGHKL